MLARIHSDRPDYEQRTFACGRCQNLESVVAKINVGHLVMELFIHQQNLLFFRKQLAETPDEKRRLQLLKLLMDEETKNTKPPLAPQQSK